MRINRSPHRHTNILKSFVAANMIYVHHAVPDVTDQKLIIGMGLEMELQVHVSSLQLVSKSMLLHINYSTPACPSKFLYEFFGSKIDKTQIR